ncbi:hypothetical protein K501DRAFT_267126 [Backusella circina FSU 941]|nr:hypothetical protein K501DRAFT_267126 [Backusella circina FSU 941]
MRNILCLSMVILATMMAIVFAAPSGIIQNINLRVPELRLENKNDQGSNSTNDKMAPPPLQAYRVKDIQGLSYINLAKFYADLIKYNTKKNPNANINAYVNRLTDAFDQARVPGTIMMDNAIYTFIMDYRSFGYRLESEPERFRNFQLDALDAYSPFFSAVDMKDFRRIVLSIGNTYY